MPAAAETKTTYAGVPDARGLASKRCVLCGEDCAGTPRKKDEFGRYAHSACLEQKKRSIFLDALRDDRSMMYESKQTVRVEPLTFAGLQPVARFRAWCRDPEAQTEHALAAAGAAGVAASLMWVTIAAWSGGVVALLAIPVGAVSGLGASVAAGRRLSRSTARIAAVAALFVLLFARAGVETVRPKTAVIESASIDAEEIEPIARAQFASGVALELMNDGAELRWPAGSSADRAAWYPEDYPETVVMIADERWSRMTDAGRRMYQDQVLEGLRANDEFFQAPVIRGGVPLGLDFWSVVCIVFGVAAAFKIAAAPARERAAESESMEPVEDELFESV